MSRSRPWKPVILLLVLSALCCSIGLSRIGASAEDEKPQSSQTQAESVSDF